MSFDLELSTAIELGIWLVAMIIPAVCLAKKERENAFIATIIMSVISFVLYCGVCKACRTAAITKSQAELRTNIIATLPPAWKSFYDSIINIDENNIGVSVNPHTLFNTYVSQYVLREMPPLNWDQYRLFLTMPHADALESLLAMFLEVGDPSELEKEEEQPDG